MHHRPKGTLKRNGISGVLGKKKALLFRSALGADGGTRTHDLLITNQLL
jgi:hypothetical protein